MGRPRKNRTETTPSVDSTVSTQTETSDSNETIETKSTIDISLDDLGNVPSFNQTPETKVLENQALIDSVEVVHPGKLVEDKPKKPKAVKVAERETEALRRKLWHRGG